MNNINIRNMKKGQSGVISAVKVDGHLGQRIREMGLVPGTKVKIQGRAPLFASLWLCFPTSPSSSTGFAFGLPTIQRCRVVGARLATLQGEDG